MSALVTDVRFPVDMIERVVSWSVVMMLEAYRVVGKYGKGSR